MVKELNSVVPSLYLCRELNNAAIHVEAKSVQSETKNIFWCYGEMGKKWKANSDQESNPAFLHPASAASAPPLSYDQETTTSTHNPLYVGGIEDILYFQPMLYSDMQDPVDMCRKILACQNMKYVWVGKGTGMLHCGWILCCLHEVHSVLSDYFSSTGMVARLYLAFW